jgi:hypothetical protein
MSNQLRDADRQRRSDLAELLGKISDCLAEVSVKIRAGDVPYGHCAELLTYANELPSRINKQVGEDKANELGQQLADAHNVEQFGIEVGALADKEPSLASLDEAAGTFRALSNLVRL